MQSPVQKSKLISPGVSPIRQGPTDQQQKGVEATRTREIEIWFWLLIALIAGCLGSLMLAPHLLAF